MGTYGTVIVLKVKKQEKNLIPAHFHM